MIEILISYINLAERIKILLPSIHHKPLNFNRLRRDEGTKVRRYLRIGTFEGTNFLTSVTDFFLVPGRDESSLSQYKGHPAPRFLFRDFETIFSAAHSASYVWNRNFSDEKLLLRKKF